LSATHYTGGGLLCLSNSKVYSLDYKYLGIRSSRIQVGVYKLEITLIEIHPSNMHFASILVLAGPALALATVTISLNLKSYQVMANKTVK
jgi:hypothetical protein